MHAKFRTITRSILSAMAFLISGLAYAEPVMVSSLVDLLPYLDKDNVEVRMEPGTYTITAEDAQAGVFGSENFEDFSRSLLLFKGSNSTYDFTDVTINVETAVFKAFGHVEVYEVHTMGNNITIKNLTLVDYGSVDDAPAKGACNIVMDGRNNLIEGLHLTVKGCYPYGYGEFFGKGPKRLIRGTVKHSAFLVRGKANHVKDCTIIHRAFGHAIFMQACEDPIIENCYVEGEMRKTDDLWKDKGKGSLMDETKFMTYFGYRLPRGYMFCTGEEGIRAYNGGHTYIDGKVTKGGTKNPTILNCTIKYMRGGVTLTHAHGKKYVEGTTALGCSRGFAIGSGDIVNCYADVQYGPALGVDYERDSNMNAEITLLPHEGETVNGTGHVAYLIGKNHKVVFKSEIEDHDKKYIIQVGGDKRGIGNLAEKETLAARNIQLNNQSGFRVALDRRSEDCIVQSVGKVKNSGRNNKVH